MNRRKVLQSFAATSLALPLYPYARAHSQAESRQKRGSFALDGNHLRFFNTAIEKSFQITMLADTHLFTDDMRGEFYRPYSARMAKAYNRNPALPHGPADESRSWLSRGAGHCAGRAVRTGRADR
ncbi:MAG: hypothetical protein R3C61_16940 [Bacteroidia bacterium]